MKLITSQNTVINNALSSSTMAVATLFVVDESFRNTVTEHTCYVNDTINFFTKTMAIGVTVYLNGTIISNFIIILGEII